MEPEPLTLALMADDGVVLLPLLQETNQPHINKTVSNLIVFIKYNYTQQS